MEDTAARGYLATYRTCSIPQLVKFEEKMMQIVARIAIPSTFDRAGGTPAPIVPLSFPNSRPNPEGSQKSQ